ncbi:RNA-directed DNA polymerase, eukaryota, Reverse transcriptase zinc-binding domain protein [Artemisia annua]|uniref:RNA-directed DNA polymerase, eukaryota, Reverse transcriptase zinc-binding domain protein n=1 Tax=Artemisia annua TaxID=35608 RepID=A0A2U1Q3C0_ARTAN|nr:RNA-directed DNA polymerase, eukaryota, Reverse transcriptase zinc-binding domain protein [Artemisia annua]
MGVWEKKDDMRCVFCKNVPDSHNHLFFECDFTGKIWNRLKIMVMLDHASNSWSDIQVFMLGRPINKNLGISCEQDQWQKESSVSFVKGFGRLIEMFLVLLLWAALVGMMVRLGLFFYFLIGVKRMEIVVTGVATLLVV